MLWADGPEVTVIDGRDGVQPQSLGNSHKAGIDPAESVIGVLAGQCSDPLPVIKAQLLQLDFSVDD